VIGCEVGWHSACKQPGVARECYSRMSRLVQSCLLIQVYSKKGIILALTDVAGVR